MQARHDSFVIIIGKIDLKGLTGAQTQEKLAAVFGAPSATLHHAASCALNRVPGWGVWMAGWRPKA